MSATGVVIGAEGPGPADVDRITLRTNDGEILELKIGTLDVSNGGLPAAHLREHLASAEPITVYFDPGATVYRYTDAAE